MVADWASQQTGAPLRNWFHAVGVVDDAGAICGAASFHDMNGSNVELAVHCPRALRAGLVKQLFRFAFVTLGAHRVTIKTPRQNSVIKRHAPRFGFKFEGIMRHYYGPTKRLDAILFGLLKDDARRYWEGTS